MSKYHPEVTLDVSWYEGLSPDFGGSIKIVSENERFTFDLDPRPVMNKTIACFRNAIREELEHYNVQNNSEFCDAVYAGFCEYMERLFSGRMNR